MKLAHKKYILFHFIFENVQFWLCVLLDFTYRLPWPWGAWSKPSCVYCGAQWIVTVVVKLGEGDHGLQWDLMVLHGSWQTLGKLTSLTIDKEEVSKTWVCSELGEDNLLEENNSEDNSHRRPQTSEDITPKRTQWNRGLLASGLFRKSLEYKKK